MVQELSPETQRDLILSLGTHQTRRRLSPVEVARLIDEVYRKGASFQEIAQLVNFGSTSTLREIHRLLALSPDIQHLVGWGKPTASTLPMKSAQQIARLSLSSDQLAATEATLLHKLTSEETRQLVEMKIRSLEPIDDCVHAVLRLRPTVERRHLFLGAVTSSRVCQHLETLTQIERDEIFEAAVNHCFGKWPNWSGKLGPSRFAITGGLDFAEAIDKLPKGFEQAISLCLEGFLEL